MVNKTVSRTRKYNSRMIKINRRTKTKTTKIIRKSLIKFIGGGEVFSPKDFFSNLKSEYQSIINSSIKSPDMDLENIKDKYRNQQQYHLYDFIFDLNLAKQPKLIKVWDHMRNDPESITAGLPGIHIYVIIDQNIKPIFTFIGKFTRQ
jgi:hypothetical protein